MFYYLNCYKCKKSVKVSIENYRMKKRIYCIKCLKKTFDKIKKKLNIFNFWKLCSNLGYPISNLPNSIFWRRVSA